MTHKNYISSIASQFTWDEKKLLDKLANEEFKDFKPSEEFQAKLDWKLQEKIKLAKEHKIDKEVMDSIPRKIKWRFYLTWYWYAICSFLVLFLIWFCTNIFTWTIKIPTKYTYLEENKAFWSLENWELVYNYDTDITNNSLYDENIDDLDYMEDTIETEESVNYTKSSSLTAKLAKTQWATMTATENYLDAYDEVDDENIFSKNYLFNKDFKFNQTYRFAYKSKIFPKLANEYPVYKVSWILMWSNTPNQVLKSLKIWDISFKNFQDLEIAGLYIEQNTKNWYYISFDSNSQILNFYPNDSRQAQKFDDKLPSKKQIIKSIEKDLKQLGISVKNYWDAEIDIDNYDETMGIINVFYPLKIQWKEVRDAEMEERIWMQIAYDLNLQKVVSVIWTDIATYDVSNYPILDKSYIEKEIEKWWEFFNQWALHENSTLVLFDNMQIVYIPKYENWITYYVPAIKWEVWDLLENYKWPKFIFQEIVQ